MGVFTEDMARLGEEIAAGHACRIAMLNNLKNNIAELKTDVAEMLTKFGKERAETRHHMQSELSAFTSRLKHFAGELSEQVIDMRKGFHQQRTDMLGTMNDSLGRFIAALKTSVADYAAYTAPQPPASNPPETTGQGGDDLTQVPGIGARRQQLLNRAGIHTFARLAQCTPEQLTQVLGNHGGPAKVEAWIAHAQAMAR
jgi:predicted flap endonuclease-1-like 5' DNA nuclease